MLMQLSEAVGNSPRATLPASIKVISQNLFFAGSEFRSESFKENRCLEVFENSLVLMWPSEETEVFHLNLLWSNHPGQDLPAVNQLRQQSLDSLLVDPFEYPSSFWFISDDNVQEYIVSTGKIEQKVNLKSANPLTQTYYLDIRSKNGQLQVLVLRDSRTIKQVVFFHGTNNEFSHEVYNGTSGVLLGELNEQAEKLVVIREDRSSAALVSLTDFSTEIVNCSMKIKHVFWSPLQSGLAVLYETLHDHSLRKSTSAETGRSEDLDVYDKEWFKLEYDEMVSCVKWNVFERSVAVASSKRILLLNETLEILKDFRLNIDNRMPLSLYWYGTILCFSDARAVYYIREDPIMLCQTLSPSVICGVMNDRLILACGGTTAEILVRPIMMLEPLLSAVIPLCPAKEIIINLVKKMNTPLLTDFSIEILIENEYNEAACFLAEYSNSPSISLRTHLKALFSMKRYEEIISLLVYNKELSDLHEVKHIMTEIQTDHNWALEKELLKTASEFFENAGQIEKAAKCLELGGYYEELQHFLTEISGSNSTPVSSVFFVHTTLPELKSNYPPERIFPISLGYGESPFMSKADSTEIPSMFKEHLGQWFGWGSLRDQERNAPEYINHSANEESVELTEIESLIIYLRFDEGKDEAVNDAISSKKWAVHSSMWGDLLEEGEPLDYDDKWGKKCSPNYSLKFNTEDRLILDELTLANLWSVEFWLYVHATQNTVIFKTGAAEFRIINSSINIANHTYEIQLEPASSGDVPKNISARKWCHLAFTYNNSVFKVYINSNPALRSNSSIERADNIIFGGFEGKLTELRIWKTERTSEQIKDVFRCPLEVISEKKKSKWANIQIKKDNTDPSKLTLNKPAAPKKLLLPAPAKKLLAPARKLPAPTPKPAPTEHVFNFQEEFKEQDLSDHGVFSKPESTNNSLEAAYRAFEAKDYKNAYQLFEELYKDYDDKCRKTGGERKTRLKTLLEKLSQYKFAVKLLEKIGKIQETDPLASTAMFNILIQLNLSATHRKQLAVQAVDRNLSIGNYGITYRIIEGLNFEDLEETAELCKESSLEDNPQYVSTAKHTQEYITSHFNRFKN